MTTKEKAKQLVKVFGKKLAKKVAKELLSRDKQWAKHLNKWYPGQWDHSSKESNIMFREVIDEINKL